MTDEKHSPEKSKFTLECIETHDCIYCIYALIHESSLNTDEILTKSMHLMQNAWMLPEQTCVRITTPEKVFRTENFVETSCCISASKAIGGKPVITVDVFQITAEKNVCLFGTGEKLHLDAVTELLATYLERDLAPGEKLDVPEDWEIVLSLLMKTDPRGALRLTRRMIFHLYRIQNEEINTLLATEGFTPGADPEWHGINIPTPREDLGELDRIQTKVFGIARKAMTHEEISKLFQTWLKSEKGRSLLYASQRQGIPLGEITAEINRYWEISEDARALMPEDARSIRAGLISRFFTNRLKYLIVAKDYIQLDDFVSLTKAIVGPFYGEGKLGGKSAGLFLARKIVEAESRNNSALEGIKVPESWYITSDTMKHMSRYNDVDYLLNIKYLESSKVMQEYLFLEQLIKNLKFPPDIVSGLKRILDEIGDGPIIVRSSSLLEDGFDAAFSGKYKSLYLVNAGTPEERLSDLMNAIAEIYASLFAPSPLEYRRERGLLDFSEEMGLLIQKVVGTRIGPYFVPAFAGVSLSNNEFRWSPRIERQDGMVRLVMGLGTRAVDRVGNDYPLLIAPFRPDIRVNTMAEQKIQYSQHYLDVINLEKGTLETVDAADLLKKYWDEFPLANQIVSLHSDGMLRPAQGVLVDSENSEMIVTFDRLMEKGNFLAQIRALLGTLKEKLGTPVEIEFAHDGRNLYLLQCRPQHQSLEQMRVSIPRDIAPSKKIFTASKYVTDGRLDDIEYIVYVDPGQYGALQERSELLEVAKAIGHLNKHLPRRKFILMGPGRWGSRGDIKLGVPIQYSDINNTCLLIEVARQKEGYQPDLSFGTHFFQDLVEARILYLPLYPDEEGNLFNEEFFEKSINRFAKLAPKYRSLENVIKVIWLADTGEGRTLSVVMDGDANSALAYIAVPKSTLPPKEPISGCL